MRRVLKTDLVQTYPILFRTPLIIQHSLIGSKENWKTVAKVCYSLTSSKNRTIES